jgi:FAD:protein FMN transferase
LKPHLGPDRCVPSSGIFFFLGYLLFAPFALPAAERPAAIPQHVFNLPKMGTRFNIIIYHRDAKEAQKAAMAAFDRIEELEDIFSDYRERSEVNLLCLGAVGSPVNISPELFRMLTASLRISELSGGAFDVTIGPVVQLWREARKNRRLPDPEEIRRVQRLVGYRNVILDPDAQTAMLRLAHMKIDFGGIAKGYASDQALVELKARGMPSSLVAGGGDMAVGSPPPGKPGWKILIKNPEPGSGEAPDYVTLHDTGIGTSGDTFQFLEIDGRRYSHIINPATGTGLTDAASTTIIAPDGITADALATAANIMPIGQALKMVESLPGVSAAMVRRGPQGVLRFATAGFPRTANFNPDIATKPAAR